MGETMSVADQTFPSSLRYWAAVVHQLPVISPVTTRIVNQHKRNMRSESDILRAIESDPGLSAKIVSIANSLWFGHPGRFYSSVQDAVARIGLELARNTVNKATFAAEDSVMATYGQQLKDLWAHTMLTAYTAREIARLLPAERKIDIELVYITAMIHDIGRLVIMTYDPCGYRLLTATGTLVPRSSETLVECESRCFGVTHAELGEKLVNAWGLPELICGAVAKHHSVHDDCAREANVLLAILQIAERLIEQLMPHASESIVKSCDKCLRFTGLQAQDLSEVAEKLSAQFKWFKSVA